MDGTTGQDRESYTDDQDRDNYTVEEPEAETAPAPKRDRRVKNSPLTTYLWEQVPRQLIADARAKTKREGTSIKAVLVRLLRDWTYAPS